jgi:hypothetical protein
VNRDNWKIGAGDPTVIFFPGVARPAKMGSADRAQQACRAANNFADVLRFLRFVREHATDPQYTRLEFAERAQQLHAQCCAKPETTATLSPLATQKETKK